MTSPTTAIAAFIFATVAVAGPLVYDGTKALTKEQPVTMAAMPLEYRDDKIYQQFVVTGHTHVVAAWQAKILRDGQVLCEGSSRGGTASYGRNEPAKGYTPSEWTGDTSCPGALQSGDQLWARWDYVADGVPGATERTGVVD